jgi:L-erythro-3,5-diaminohexanoate dehydrogenase
VARTVRSYAGRAPSAPGAPDEVSVVVLGGAGKSGSLSLAAAADAGATRRVAVVRDDTEAALLEGTGLATHVVVADARSPIGLSEALAAVGGPADLTVVCVDVTGCEQPAILATAEGGTVIFFSMATNFAAAALGAEGLAADVTMLVGNGYVPGHAAYALELLRGNAAVRTLFEGRLED